MNERERIAKILTRPITPAERRRYSRETNAIVDMDEFIRIKEALLVIAETTDMFVLGSNP